MKLKDAAILYNPGGDCQITRHGHETPHQRRLECSTGAVNTEVANLAPVKARMYVLTEALRLIVHQGLAPETVHEAFLNIDKYRQACTTTMPGIQARRSPLRS